MQTKNKSKRIKNPSRIKSILLLLLISASAITALPIFNASTAGADPYVYVPGDELIMPNHTKYESMSPAEQIKSHIYLYAMGYCMRNSQLSGWANWTTLNPSGYHSISNSDAQAGAWWWVNGNQPRHLNETTTYVGPYMVGGDIGGIKNNGEVNCSSTDLVTGAMTLWGLDPIEVLCNSGFERQNYGDNTGSAADIQTCINDGSGGRTDALESATGHQGSSANNYTVMGNKFMSYIIDQIGNPPLTGAQQYVYYRHTLNQSCIAGIDTTEPDKNVATGDSAYNHAKWVDITSDPMKILQTDNAKSSYGGKMKLSDGLNLRISSGLAKDKKSCGYVFGEMNKFAPDYLIWAKSNPDAAAILNSDSQTAGPGAGANGKPTCGSAVTGLGWLICPVINAVVGLNDTMWSLVQGLLTVSPLQQNKPIYDAWGGIRSLANAIFVIFFMVIIFSQLTGAGITNYGIKKMLPKIIVAAILVNVSFIIVQGAVDLSNIIGSSLYKMIVAMIPNTDQNTWSMLLNSLMGTGGTVLVGGAGLAIVAGSATGFWMLLPFLLMGLLGLVAAFLTLAFRQAAIPILAILAPLAFVAYLLPNTESWFKKWRGLLMSMLILYPLAAVIFAGSQFASRMIIGDGSNFLNYLIGMTVLALPLFSLPFLARQGGAIQGKVAGALNGLAQKARPGISNWAKERQDAARADYLANGPRTGLGKRLDRNRFLGAPRQSARNLALRSNNRKNKMEADKLNLQTDMDNSETSNMGKGRPSNGLNRSVSTIRDPVSGEILSTREHRGIGGKQSKAGLLAAKEESKATETAASRDFTSSAMGSHLKGETKMAELGLKKADEDVSHHVATDTSPDGGADLHHELGRAQLQTKTDTANIATRIEKDPTLLDLRLQNVDAGKAQSTAAVDTADLYERASTDTVAVAGTDLAAVTPAMRAQAKATKLAEQVTASKAQRTKVVTDQEYSNAIAKTYVIPAGTVLRDGTVLTEDTIEIPETATAREAASIDPNGVQHVQAVETARLSKAKADNVTAGATLFAAQHYTTDEKGDYMKVVETGVRRDGVSANPEEREAAMDALVKTGSVKAMAKIQDQLSAMASAGDPSVAQLQQAYNAMLVTSSKKPKSSGGAVLGGLAAGNLTDTFEDGLIKYAQAGKFAASEFVAMDKDEIGLLADALNSRPGDLSRPQKDLLLEKISGPNGVLNDPLYRGSVTPEKRAQLDLLVAAAT